MPVEFPIRGSIRKILVLKKVSDAANRTNEGVLGFSVYLTLLMSSENNAGLIVTGVLHVINGSLTLAAGVVLAMQMNRNLIQLSGA